MGGHEWLSPPLSLLGSGGGGLLALLVLTLLLANIVAVCLERARDARIEIKVTQLRGGEGAVAPRPVPVTLLVGWLGAGKTTVLNHLLASPGGRRLCVIENEAGAVSIDHAMLQMAGGGGLAPGGVIVLPNGCLCCVGGSGGGDELERVLDRLLSLQASRTTFDAVVVEASGLVDPAPLVAAFFGARLSARYALDAVVAVVDAQHIGAQLDGAGFLPRRADAARQIAYADIVLLSKTDIASSAATAAARSAIAHLNPTARVLVATRGEVCADLVLGCAAFDVDRARTLLSSPATGAPDGGVEVAACAADEANRPLESKVAAGMGATAATQLGYAAPHPRHHHSDGIATITLRTRGRAPLPLARLRGWLQQLVETRWRDLFRIKGLVWVHGAEASDGGGADGATDTPDGCGSAGSLLSPLGSGASHQHEAPLASQEGPTQPPGAARRSLRRRGVARATGGESATTEPSGPSSGTRRLLVVQGVHAELHAALAPGHRGSSRMLQCAPLPSAAPMSVVPGAPALVPSAASRASPAVVASALAAVAARTRHLSAASRARSGGINAPQDTARVAHDSASQAAAPPRGLPACGRGCSLHGHGCGDGECGADSLAHDGETSEGDDDVEPALVIIGRKLQEAQLRASFDALWE